jgi:hypothetical protein
VTAATFTPWLEAGLQQLEQGFADPCLYALQYGSHLVVLVACLRGTIQMPNGAEQVVAQIQDE